MKILVWYSYSLYLLLCCSYKSISLQLLISSGCPLHNADLTYGRPSILVFSECWTYLSNNWLTRHLQLWGLSFFKVVSNRYFNRTDNGRQFYKWKRYLHFIQTIYNRSINIVRTQVECRSITFFCSLRKRPCYKTCKQTVLHQSKDKLSISNFEA